MQRRFEVEKFANLMESVLRDNDYKGGWKNVSREFIVVKLLEEVRELTELLLPDSPVDANSASDIAREAADIANVAMFAADNFGDLKSEV